jgi:beta-lactamase class D
MNAKILFLFLLFFSFVTRAQTWDSIKVGKLFRNHKGTMVVYDKANEKYFRYNTNRSAERFLPASTFKIPNSLIGLETGVLQDENTMIPWDGIERPNKDWNKDHTLVSAIKYSVVPYFQELARNIGIIKYPKYLKIMNYGNQKIGEKIDFFWLDNSLKISANEQINFLLNFYDYKFSFSKSNVDIVKKIIPEEKHKNTLFKFKTGCGEKEDGKYIGWLVGYVEAKNNVYFYAFNIDAKTFEEAKELRDSIPRKILINQKFIN